MNSDAFSNVSALFAALRARGWVVKERDHPIALIPDHLR